MAYTADEIKNLALMELNHETITDWDDEYNTDIPIINAQYPLALSVALTKYPWSFADKYTKLTTSAVPDTDGYQKYKNIVAVPDGVLGNLSAYTNKELRQHADYDVLGGNIYTNLTEIYLKYTAQVDESKLPAEFIDWFKVFFACRLNSYLNADMQRQQVLDSQETFLFKVAKNIDSKRNLHETVDGNPMLWIRGRLAN